MPLIRLAPGKPNQATSQASEVKETDSELTFVSFKDL